ncbi:hypothetical protein SAMN05421874_13140 [Nonomuraea maritima]|uniref:Uncharacterized protein n=1 Tax=Nonomuraea maritima TaxID=683260 RepID=A0A1G9NLV7_9ACTN|nr:hypothetical protein SAMN05421874_13140 [Nonomuraea maritima]
MPANTATCPGEMPRTFDPRRHHQHAHGTSTGRHVHCSRLPKTLLRSTAATQGNDRHHHSGDAGNQPHATAALHKLIGNHPTQRARARRMRRSTRPGGVPAARAAVRARRAARAPASLPQHAPGTADDTPAQPFAATSPDNHGPASHHRHQPRAPAGTRHSRRRHQARQARVAAAAATDARHQEETPANHARRHGDGAAPGAPRSAEKHQRHSRRQPQPHTLEPSRAEPHPVHARDSAAVDLDRDASESPGLPRPRDVRLPAVVDRGWDTSESLPSTLAVRRRCGRGRPRRRC